MEKIISSHLYNKKIPFRFEDNVLNPSLEVERKDFLELMTLIKKELPSFVLIDISARLQSKKTNPQSSQNPQHSQHPPPLILIYHLLYLETYEFLRIKTEISKDLSIFGIGHLWPNAEWYEKEIFDFYGISISMGHKRSQFILPQNVKDLPFLENIHDFDPESPIVQNDFETKLPIEQRKDLSLEHFNSTQTPENGYAENQFRLDGTKIMEAKIVLGFEHRGIETICEKKSPAQVLPLLEGVNPMQAPFFSQLWCALLEEVFKIKLTDRAQAIRMIAIEMIRIQDHLKTFFIMIRLLKGYGYSSLLSTLFENVYSLSNGLSTSSPNELFKFSCPGGVLVDISSDWRNECAKTLSLLEKELSSWKKVMLSSVTIKERLLRDRVSGKKALEFGFSGPLLRACGINYDIRKARPYYLYHQLDFDVPLGLHGSAYDRFLIRLEEIVQSTGIIFQLLGNLPSGSIVHEDIGHLVEREHSSLAWARFFSEKSALAQDIFWSQEGPGGETGHYLILGEKNRIERLKIHTPSFNHAQAYEKLIIGFDIEDFALIQGSLNFSIGEVER
ncbi:MAG: NADH-quinone oxidoreductase subunit C [Bacteriovoracales bacterium]|nr:NADH-quinone oxidoreductase subunit C [Bacteriovoracales bacterium]